MSQEICTHEGCGRETTRSVSKDGKCLFHCEKNDWFTTDASGNQDWSKSEFKVKAFWGVFKQEWTDGKSDFSFSVFPEISANIDFPSSIVLKKSTGEDVDPNLSFYGSRFIGTVIFGGYTFWKFVDFSSTTFALDVFFFGVTFVQKASFGNAKFMQHVDFSDATFKEDASFSSTTFMKAVDFNSSSFKQKAFFNESAFRQGANFNDATFHDSVKFRDVRFSGNSTFEATIIEDSAWFENCIFDESVSFLDLSVPALTFHSATINGHFRIGANLVAKMKHLELFQCTFKKDAVVLIDNLIVDTLSIKHLVCLSPAIKIGSLQVIKELNINDSMLSGAEMNNVSLENAPIMNIFNSSLSKTIFNNVKWGNVERMMPDPKTISENMRSSGVNMRHSSGVYRDTFRQLKAANEEQKNYLQANEFYMMEMKAYGEEIAGKPDKRQERFEFWMGDKLSNFSNDWVRPIIWFLGLTGICYLLSFLIYIAGPMNEWQTLWIDHHTYIPSTGGSFTEFVYFDLREFSNFFAFMNPLETKYQDHNTPALIWIPYKILGGLMIYQIIISLRRKTRR